MFIRFGTSTRVTDRRTDRQTELPWHILAIAYAVERKNYTTYRTLLDSWARTRGAQLSAGYTVNTYSKPPLYDASKCGNVTLRS